ncbi:MAG: DUF4397 domain-containing protein [Meiothermus sp.]|uniref:DUF4397 domain-containing protein n=1 Tax=Meiothermus sp. TaxID=1955249 RepID=UPI0026003910|nr:DUF4397 domain-containing protein [Meiothermus sp.]MCS7067046.1 DUF4397 domain-containing protein [Meiothermus sp.]MCX7600785.1 DUF4397 domain-containing protein [Meiothermus sp.]MDW8424543.1 DUF4397 domain-containing protein [Meiothermus sp.]
MKKWLVLVALALMGFSLAQGNTAFVRFAHLVPDAPAVDIVSGGSKVFEAQAFKDVTYYAEVPAGSLTLTVQTTGQNPAKVADVSIRVQAGKYYTVMALGTLSTLKARLVEDRLAPAEGVAKVRIVHASPDAPAVDVALKGGPVLFRNLAFNQISGYGTVPAAAYNLEVRPTGTTNVALPLEGVAFEAGKVYSVFAVGLLAGQTLEVIVVEDSFGSP